jgi:hypothetical protein
MDTSEKPRFSHPEAGGARVIDITPLAESGQAEKDKELLKRVLGLPPLQLRMIQIYWADHPPEELTPKVKQGVTIINALSLILPTMLILAVLSPLVFGEMTTFVNITFGLTIIVLIGLVVFMIAMLLPDLIKSSSEDVNVRMTILERRTISLLANTKMTMHLFAMQALVIGALLAFAVQGHVVMFVILIVFLCIVMFWIKANRDLITGYVQDRFDELEADHKKRH